MQTLQGKKIHFIGIGGSGMSGLARIALSDGISVSGSDAKDSSVLTALTALGAKVSAMHEAANVEGADVVIYSTAISATNPEMAYAVERSIPILTRAQALALLMKGSRSIAVAGTHGKTTTSSMMTVALQACGVDPSFAIGGTINTAGTNAHSGTGTIFVAEADESDGSFLAYKPTGAIITNIEADHMETYDFDFSRLTKTYIEFLHNLPFYGLAVMCIDDPVIRDLLVDVARPMLTYGFSDDAAYRVRDLTVDQGRSTFVIERPDGLAELQVSLNMPGRHNALNAAAARLVWHRVLLAHAYRAQIAGAVAHLQLFGGGKARLQADRNVASDEGGADRQDGGVNHGVVVEDGNVAGLSTDIYEHGAKLSLGVGER